MRVLILFVLSSIVLCICGQSINRLSRKESENASLIVGGRYVEIIDYKYTVFMFIFYSNRFRRCGGAALSTIVVITAAHCLIDKPYKIKVKVGVTSIYELPHHGAINEYETKIFLIHPYYEENTDDYDVGLVGVTIQEHGLIFEAAVLPHDNAYTPGPPLGVTILGWGSPTGRETEFSTHLKAVTVPVIDYYECNSIIYHAIHQFMTPEKFCAGDLHRDIRNSCYGDSGGPAVDSVGTLVGVVSGGLNCYGPHLPSVFVSVARVRTWIKEVTDI